MVYFFVHVELLEYKLGPKYMTLGLHSNNLHLWMLQIEASNFNKTPHTSWTWVPKKVNTTKSAWTPDKKMHTSQNEFRVREKDAWSHLRVSPVLPEPEKYYQLPTVVSFPK